MYCQQVTFQVISQYSNNNGEKQTFYIMIKFMMILI